MCWRRCRQPRLSAAADGDAVSPGCQLQLRLSQLFFRACPPFPNDRILTWLFFVLYFGRELSLLLAVFVYCVCETVYFSDVCVCVCVCDRPYTPPPLRPTDQPSLSYAHKRALERESESVCTSQAGSQSSPSFIYLQQNHEICFREGMLDILTVSILDILTISMMDRHRKYDGQTL